MATPSDHESIHSPATTVLTYSATSCCSPFTVASATSTISSAPSSPAGDKSHHHQYDRPSIDSIAVNAIAVDEDAWQHITDPKERRKIQNRIAQRKYREKEAAKREQSRRDARNQQLAGGSYARPWVRVTPQDNNNNNNTPASNLFVHPHTTRATVTQDIQHEEFNGVPWGGINFEHIARKSRMESQNEQRDMMLRWEQRQRMLAQREWMQRQRQLKRQRQEQQELQTMATAATAVSVPFPIPLLDINTSTNATTATSLYGGACGDAMLPVDPPQVAPFTMDTFGGSMFFDATLPFYAESTPIDPTLLVSTGGCGSVRPGATGMGLDQTQGGGEEGVEVGVMRPTFPIEDEMEIELLAWPD